MRAFIVAVALVALAPGAKARNVCRDAGLRGIPLMNCSMRHYLRCAAHAVRATQFDATEPRACPKVKGSHIVADWTLPCGTPVKVTNARNGKTVRAKIGDRGPGTIARYDLSYPLGAELGMGTGSGCVVLSVDGEKVARD